VLPNANLPTVEEARCLHREEVTIFGGVFEDALQTLYQNALR
jgi:hypothetical protein